MSLNNRNNRVGRTRIYACGDSNYGVIHNEELVGYRRNKNPLCFSRGVLQIQKNWDCVSGCYEKCMSDIKELQSIMLGGE